MLYQKIDVAFIVSVTVGNSSSETLHSICGSLLIALSLTGDGRLSTLLKCSAHLFKIASLSVRSVLPSAPCVLRSMMTCAEKLDYSEGKVRRFNLTLSS